MDVRTCRNCKKMFQYRGKPICPDCAREIDDKFNEVKYYMYDNPSASIDKICEDTGATVEMVTNWLREGRLVVATGSAALISCVKCGKPIASGRMCEGCTQNMSSQISSASKAMAQTVQKKKESEQAAAAITRIPTKK